MNLSAQRAAIEELSSGLRPCVIGPDRRYFLDKREVFFLGFSLDAGGTKVAVFGGEPAREHPAVEPAAELVCAGAVFLRSPEPGEETEKASQLFGDGTNAEIVESLNVSTIEPRQFRLTRVGDKALYPILITAYRPDA